MPKSKKRRKNGTIVSGKIETQKKSLKNEAHYISPAQTGEIPEIAQLTGQLWDWINSNGYKSDIDEMHANKAPASEIQDHLEHLCEGYHCAQNHETWAYIPPIPQIVN